MKATPYVIDIYLVYQKTFFNDTPFLPANSISIPGFKQLKLTSFSHPAD